MKRTVPATAAVLLGLSASSASAQVLSLQGSDTLFDMMNDPSFGVLANCPAANGALDYGGGGSSNGETATEGDLQEIAPMSRFLDATACSHVQTPTDLDTEGGWTVALDGLVALTSKDSTSVGSPQGAHGNGTCDSLRWSGSMALPSGGNYTFSDWRTVLRIVYAGQHQAQITGHDPCTEAPPSRSPIAQKDCGSEVRRTLVGTWSNLFEGGCANGKCAGGLKHAFRRDDVSGTTDVFLELLALPPIASVPFCNGNETQDNDPIRRQCDGNGHTNGEQVCKGANPASPSATNQGLGLVLPVLVPQVDPYASAPNQLCSNAAFGGAAFGDVAMPFGTTSCPNGAALVAGTCKWPRRSGTASGNFNCIASANDRPAGTPNTFDARVYNLTLRNSAGQIQNYQRRTSAGGTQNLPMTSAYYRIHQNRSLSTTTLTNVQDGCSHTNETQQIGCLVEASPCSMGYSGAQAIVDVNEANAASVRLYTAVDSTGRTSDRWGFGLRSPVETAPGVAVYPTDANVRLLLEDTCTGSLALNGGREDRYSFARRLWLNTIDGAPNSSGVGVNTGSQTTAQLQAQYELVQCMLNRTIVDNAATGAGFVTLPPGAIPFTSCP